ncbi:hypothetical protein CCH79_00021138, partial [Gambusia affinis]
GTTNKQTPTPFISPSQWEPPIYKIKPEILELIQQDKIGVKKIPIEKVNDNLTMKEEEALKQLKQQHSIIIKPADKGSAIVIMDKKDYRTEALRQLQDPEFYRELQGPIYPQTQNEIRRLLTQLKESKFINRQQLIYLLGTNPPRPRYFYLLPKIHKQLKDWTLPNRIPKGRPIVSDCGTYANIYMAKWERECFQKCTKLPDAYYRYLDDIWGIWNYNYEDLINFTEILNNHHPSI